MLIDEKQAGAIISSNLIRIRVYPEVIAPEYLLLLLRYSAEVQQKLRKLTSTGGRLLVNTRTLSELMFPVPDRSFQDSVVECAKNYEEVLGVFDANQSTVTSLFEQLYNSLS
jgi:hypothetical protein